MVLKCIIYLFIFYPIDFINTNWILDESYLKADYPEVYPKYARDEIAKPNYIPVITNLKMNKDGQTVVYLGRMDYVDGIEISENIHSKTNLYYVEDVPANSSVICYDEDNKGYFPKTYSAKSFFHSVEGKIYSNSSEEMEVKSPILAPKLSVPMFRDIKQFMDEKGYHIAINDRSHTYYENIKYHIFRKTPNSDYTEIAVIDRQTNQYNGHVTIFTDTSIEEGKIYDYAVQSEITFTNGVSMMTEISQPLSMSKQNAGVFERPNLRDLRDVGEAAPKAISYRAVMPRAVDETNEEGVELNWNRIDGSDGYEIFRKPSYGYIYKSIGIVENGQTEYVDTDVIPGTSYDYVVVNYSNTDTGRIYHGNSESATIDYKFIDNHTHTYETEITPPTCTEDGCTVYTCSFCGDTYTEPIPAKGHSFGEWMIETNPTISASGTEKRVCGECGTVETREIPKLDYLKGDINKDGNVNSSDARLALRISARLEEATEERILIGDVNDDKKITSADARKILRVAARLESF